MPPFNYTGGSSEPVRVAPTVVVLNTVALRCASRVHNPEHVSSGPTVRTEPMLVYEVPSGRRFLVRPAIPVNRIPRGDRRPGTDTASSTKPLRRWVVGCCPHRG